MSAIPEPTGPPAGQKMPEIGHCIAAPCCTRILADLAAEVVEVELSRGGRLERLGLVPADLGIGEILGLLLGHEDFDTLAQRALIALQRQDAIGLLVNDLLHDLAPAAHDQAGKGLSDS
ncbi:MAG TPA: hypothetical protein VND19_06185 [Acetobacteraceae bacterium]|nr:hypothetical protein [Acetobacteraceae bacterium]